MFSLNISKSSVNPLPQGDVGHTNVLGLVAAMTGVTRKCVKMISIDIMILDGGSFMISIYNGQLVERQIFK